MANKIKDLSGMRAGKLTAVKVSRIDDYGRAVWLCLCDCGKELERRSAIFMASVKLGKASHCGCSPALKTHGMTRGNKNLHWVWAAMIQRCENANSKDYPVYGGRGISVCPEWRNDFGVFAKWAIGNGYAPKMTIDRTDNNAGYTPKNCAWRTIKDQMRNQSKTVFVEWKGEKRSLQEWSDITGISDKTLRGRIISRGWDIDRAMTLKPVIGRNQHD